MKMFFRKVHRWLGLLMALQIAAWMLSGLYFSLFPIQEIRGEHLVESSSPPGRALVATAPPAAEALAAVDRHLGQGWELESLSVQANGNQAFWRVEGATSNEPFTRLVTFESVEVSPPLTAGEAERRAQQLLVKPGHGAVVEWIEEAHGNLEFRGRPLPVWRVSFSEPENARLYLDPWTGDLLATRTDRWRIFDFLWMLHIMDFDTRDDFNTPLLQIAAFLGLLVALGGVVLWALTTRLFRRKYSRA